MKYLILLAFLCSTTLVQGQFKEFTTSGRLILGTHIERTASLSSGDIDNDGDNDIILANGRHWPGQNRVFVNNGKGIFTVSS